MHEGMSASVVTVGELSSFDIDSLSAPLRSFEVAYGVLHLHDSHITV